MSSRLALNLLIGGLLIVYAAQIASPLRLNTDGVKYLSMAESASRGQGFFDRGSVANVPRGFPMVIFLLGRVGCATVPYIIAVQWMFLVGSVWISSRLIHKTFPVSAATSNVIVAIVLGSIFTIKHMLLPIAEMGYMCTSLATLLLLACAAQAVGGKRWLMFLAAVASTMLAITFRTVGIALLPAVVWQGVLLSPGSRDWIASTRSKVLLGLAGVTCLTGSCLIAGRVYLQQVGELYRTLGPIHAAMAGAWDACIGVASILTNIPSPAVWMDCILAPIGAAAIIAIGFDLWRRRKAVRPVEIYLAIVIAILCFWPFGGDPRFWLPIYPLVLAQIFVIVRPLKRFRAARMAAIASMAGYAAIGVVGIAATTRVSFSGRDFPERFGNGSYRASYRAAFGSPLPIDDSRVDPQMVMLLRRYDPKHAVGGSTRP